jgi:hypothetical protein
LFFEKIKRNEMDSNMISAIIAGNASVYGSPAYSEKGAREKSNHWKKFVESFDWDRAARIKKQKTVGSVLGSFSKLNVKIKK